MEEVAMAMIYSQSQPHLSLESNSGLEDDDDNDGSSSSGELLRGGGGTASSGGGRSSSSLRGGAPTGTSRSFPRVAVPRSHHAAATSRAPPRHRHRHRHRHGNGGRGGTTDEHGAAADANNFHVWTTDEHAAEAYFHVSAMPGYVSFEDLIGAAALYRDGSGRPLEAAIGDPLMRTASRLYVRDDGRAHPRRQPSPGPLGTRRGSPMHAIVKKYVHPVQDFLASIFCRCIMPSHR
jgi:hypothetical protein